MGVLNLCELLIAGVTSSVVLLFPTASHLSLKFQKYLDVLFPLLLRGQVIGVGKGLVRGKVDSRPLCFFFDFPVGETLAHERCLVDWFKVLHGGNILC